MPAPVVSIIARGMEADTEKVKKVGVAILASCILRETNFLKEKVCGASLKRVLAEVMATASILILCWF